MKHLKFFIFLCILTFTVSCGQQKKYIQYKVKSGDTMSKIAQKLNMQTKDLIRLNPDVVNEPKPNTFIVVPENKLNNFKNKVEANEENITDISLDTEITLDSLNVNNEPTDDLKKMFVIYEVQKGDTFYSLTNLYDVSKEQLLILNPELKEGLKEGMSLKIKRISKVVNADEFMYLDYIKPRQEIKAALLLPFRANKFEADTLELKDIFAKNATLVNIATDFYLGAEIAIDSLRSRGVAVELNVYDTGNRRSNQFNSIIAQENLNKNDVIIGPLYSEEVQTLASNVRTPIVYPVYSDDQANFYASNIIKTSPDKKVFREELESYIKENLIVGNVIIVSDEKASSILTANKMKASLLSGAFISNVHVLSPTEGFIQKDRFLEVLQPNTNNWVVIATDKNIVVSDVINSLISLPEETTAKVFTFNKGRVYDNVDNRKLAKLGFTFVSDDFDDTSSLASRVFNKQFKRKNNTLPSYYATKGFDITFDILMRLASGKDLKKTFDEGVSQRVDTRFDYRDSNTENRGLYIVQYNPDLTLTRLK